MTDLQDLLERADRAAGTIPPPADGVEGIERLAERRHRNRRIRAGALGVIVALAMGLVFVRSVRSDGIPADRPEPRPAPAASGTLAYVLDGDVYVAEADGSNAVKIADGRSSEDCYGWSGEYWAEGAMWSPDGRYLAFRRFTDCSNPENPRDVVISDAQGNVLGTFPAAGWDIAWSPDSTRVAVWDTLFESVGVYGVDGARQAQISMPFGWQPSGDHDPAWLRDGTLAVDAVELPLDGSPAGGLDGARAAEWREDIAWAQFGMQADSPDGSHTAYVDGRSLVIEGPDGSGSVVSVTLLTLDRGTSLTLHGFSPEGDRILFSKDDDDDAGRSSLWSIGVDGSEPRLVVAGASTGEWLSP